DRPERRVRRGNGIRVRPLPRLRGDQLEVHHVTTTSAPSVRERMRAKSRVLLEALPYIREHAGKAVVVKLGGAAMEDPALAGSFAQDISLLWLVRIRPVVLHGGGPQVPEPARRLGLTPDF